MPPVTFEFELEFLTPAFIGGANPAQKADFTLKPLKSAMRYWWRQFQDMRNSPALFEKESRIFGSTKQCSPFSLRLISKEGIRCSSHRYPAPNGSGRSYLFYSLRDCRDWIEAKSCIAFTLAFRSVDEDILGEGLLSLWLASTLGGLGSRSRRGAGSFELRPASAPEEWRSQVENLFSQQAIDFHQAFQNDSPQEGFFRLLNPNSPLAEAMKKSGYFKVYDPNPGKNADAILDHIGNTMKNQRQCFTYQTGNAEHKHKAARALHQAGKNGMYTPGPDRPDMFNKTAFGLPIVCVFKQRVPGTNKIDRHQSGPKKGKIKMERWNIVLEPSQHDRRASPLFISLNRKPSAATECTANLLVLWGAFLSNNERINIIKTQKENRRTDRTPLGDVSVPGPQELITFLGSV